MVGAVSLRQMHHLQWTSSSESEEEEDEPPKPSMIDFSRVKKNI